MMELQNKALPMFLLHIRGRQLPRGLICFFQSCVLKTNTREREKCVEENCQEGKKTYSSAETRRFGKNKTVTRHEQCCSTAIRGILYCMLCFIWSLLSHVFITFPPHPSFPSKWENLDFIYSTSTHLPLLYHFAQPLPHPSHSHQHLYIQHNPSAFGHSKHP